MKTEITEQWAIGTWAQRGYLDYVSVAEKIDGVSANYCVEQRQKPCKMEYDDSTGVLYRKYKDGRSAIFKRTYSPAVNLLEIGDIENTLEGI